MKPLEHKTIQFVYILSNTKVYKVPNKSVQNFDKITNKDMVRIPFFLFIF